MRYLLFFFFLFFHSHFVFSQSGDSQPSAGGTPAPSCTGVASAACTNNEYLSASLAECGGFCSDGVCAVGIVGMPSGSNFPPPSCSGSVSIVYSCAVNCSCPQGFTLLQGQCVASSSSPSVSSSPSCTFPQVMYEGFCRDGEDSPGDCGGTYDTAVLVNGVYVCANGGCEAGTATSVYTNANGSWSVCGDGGETPSSSGSNSSPPSSSPSNGGDSSSGNSTGSNSSTGSGSGGGGGGGTGDGSGSDTGSGSGDEGIGNGTAAAANCNDNEPQCEGDPIQCAMLVQLWINNCAGYDEVELSNPADDNEAIRDNFDALMSSAEPSVNAEGVLDVMTPGGGGGNGTGSGSGSGTGSGNGNGGGLDLSGLGDAAASGAGGSCPPDRSISLGAGNFNISFQFFCDFASQISGLVILIFSYIGGMIIYRSLQW